MEILNVSSQSSPISRRGKRPAALFSFATSFTAGNRKPCLRETRPFLVDDIESPGRNDRVSLAAPQTLASRESSGLTETIQHKMALLEVVAHDLRHPAATILCCSELLAEDIDRREQREVINSIRSATESMLRLIDQTLDFAGIEAGTLRMHCRPVVLSHIVRECVSMSFPVAIRKGLRLSVVEVGSAVPVMLDPIRMRQVFNNLLENAIKYCPHNARIEVRISRTPNMVVVSVKDTGPGIDDAGLKTLFERFQTRADAPSADSGTGIGLAIAKQIVELHSGHITVKSEVGRGTTFRVCLPAQPSLSPERS